MSGPKIDTVMLERMKREQLRLEQERKLAERRKAIEEFGRSLSEIRSFANQIDMDYAKELCDAVQYEELTIALDDVEKVKAGAIRDIYILTTQGPAAETETIRQQTGQINRRFREIKADYKNKISESMKSIMLHSEKMEKIKETRAWEKELLENVTTEESFEFCFQFFVEDIKQQAETSNENLSERFRTVVERLTSYMNDEGVMRKDKVEAVDICRRICEAKDKPEELVVALNQFDAFSSAILQHRRDGMELYNDYLLYHSAINEELNVDGKGKTIIPKTLEQFENYDELEKEVRKIQKQLQALTEQTYIIKQIEEVLKEFNYGNCNQIVFRPNSTVKDYFSRKSNAASGLHIQIDEENHIMMEVVGIGKKREKGSAPSIERATNDVVKRYLLGEQNGLCKIHPQILAELEKRGIFTGVVEHYGPDEKYSKEYVSSEGYDYEESADTSNSIEEVCSKHARSRLYYKEMG